MNVSLKMLSITFDYELLFIIYYLWWLTEYLKFKDELAIHFVYDFQRSLTGGGYIRPTKL